MMHINMILLQLIMWKQKNFIIQNNEIKGVRAKDNLSPQKNLILVQSW